MDTQLATTEPSVALMLQDALANIQSGEITSQHVDVLGKMMELYERNEARQAEKDFAAAFVKLQAEMPKIEPTRGIPDRSGNIKFNYAPYEEIMRKVRPLLTQHGFTVTFDNDFTEDRVTVVCRLQHIGGHKTETRHAARVGSGPVNASPAQADGAAQTYAKRFALCSALNIVVEHDTDASDARNEGDFITAKEAADLRDRVESIGADEKAFLEYAAAESFETIYSTRLETLHAMLARKEKAKK